MAVRLEPGRRDLESPYVEGEILGARPPYVPGSALQRLTRESPFERTVFETVSPEFEEQVPLTLPADAARIPSDAALRQQLNAMGTADARAVNAAFAAFGDPVKYGNTLPPALKAAFVPLRGPQPRFRVHLARLGAEAFVLNTPLEPSGIYDNFVDHPDRLGNALTDTDRQNFVRFVMRRLLQISPIVVKPATHRRQMTRAAVLVRFFQSELTSYIPVFDKTLSLVFRTLAVQLLWRHYHGLQGGVLETLAKGGASWDALNGEWTRDLDVASVTQLVADEDAVVPTFRLTPALYRDYFVPTAASDIGYRHYNPKPLARDGHGPDMPFRLVYRRAAAQKAFVEQLKQESAAMGLPKLHETSSWQQWVKQTWDRPLLRRESKLTVILRYIGDYLEAFTVHAPHDLVEGCSEKSYLTRTFPCAVTGARVHDCVVYAVRWLHMLGRLLSSRSAPPDFSKARISLIEMPAHLGVMIRADTSLHRHVVVSINNKHAEIHELDANDADDIALRLVVQDMYRGMRTPYVARRLKADPADADALWKEVCSLSEKKLTLPYADATYPPHLRYLEHNATVARISRGLSDAVRSSWTTLHQRLDGARDQSGSVPATRVSGELKQHAANFEKALQAAAAALEKDVKPLVQTINADLAANAARVPKGATIVETTPHVPFVFAAAAYQNALQRAMLSRDLQAIDPARFFPEDDFAAAVD